MVDKPIDIQAVATAVAGALSPILVVVGGLYAARNGRMKDREANALELRREEEKSRVALLEAANKQRDDAVKRIGELEDELRNQRNDCIKERRVLQAEANRAWDGFHKLYDAVRDRNHLWRNAMTTLINTLERANVAVPPYNAPGDLPARETWYEPAAPTVGS